MNESFATVLETVADELEDRVAVVHGPRALTWRELDDRASRLATVLAERGIAAGDHVGIALWSSTEFVETLFAVMKLRAVPFNVNYRYRTPELVQLLADAPADGLVLDATLTDLVAAALPSLPTLRVLVRVGEPPSDDPLAGSAASYDEALSAAAPRPREGRSGADEWMLYTGGTTGKPKGVLNRHSGLFGIAIPNGYGRLGLPAPESLDELRAAVRELRDSPDRMVTVVAAPLMHGTGIYNTLGTLITAGTVVLLPSRSYDPEELARLVAEHRATDLVLVGDVFARPLADALDRAAAAGRLPDLGSLRRVVSIGVTWSAEAKAALLRHVDAAMVDMLAASEGGPFAMSITRRGEVSPTARFVLAPRARVLDEHGRDVRPGSGQVGELAAPADPDVRYSGAEAASAATYRVIDGVRWCVPGDLASVEADGTLVFQGRGSRVINTGGEKVFAEEVEQVIARHPAVRDVLVVGAPHPRWGSEIVAVVSAEAGPGRTLTTDDVRAFVGAELADYKRPRRVVFVDDVRRSPVGKADLAWARTMAEVDSRPPQEEMT